MKWTLLLVPLLIGCSEVVEVELTAPGPVQVEQFTVNEDLEEEPAKDMGLEPVIIIPRHDQVEIEMLRDQRWAERDSSGTE